MSGNAVGIAVILAIAEIGQNSLTFAQRTLCPLMAPPAGQGGQEGGEDLQPEDIARNTFCDSQKMISIERRMVLLWLFQRQ